MISSTTAPSELDLLVQDCINSPKGEYSSYYLLIDYLTEIGGYEEEVIGLKFCVKYTRCCLSSQGPENRWMWGFWFEDQEFVKDLEDIGSMFTGKEKVDWTWNKN